MGGFYMQYLESKSIKYINCTFPYPIGPMLDELHKFVARSGATIEPYLSFYGVATWPR